MKKQLFLILALLCAVAQGAWAQTEVSTADDLKTAVQTDGANIKLMADIELSSYLNINSRTITIDLNGKTLNRGLSELTSYGNVIRVETGGTLTIKDSGTGGTITGGYDSSGGAICVYGTLNFQGGTISGCEGSEGGAIYITSGGTVNMTGGTISGCTASADGGAIYNLGTLSITGGTISGNKANGVSGSAGGGL